MTIHFHPRTLGLIIAACASHTLAQPPTYHVRDMGGALEQLYPGNTFLNSTMRALNENGDAVGEVHLDSGQQFAFIYAVEHGVVPLPLIPGHNSAIAMDVSDRDADGLITIVGAGTGSVYDDAQTAALWRFSTVSGEVIESRNVGVLPGTDWCILIAVNNAGLAVGYAGNTQAKYDANTGLLEVLDFPARPADLNNIGQVVGGRHIGDLDGNYEQLDLPPDCTSLSISGINDLGWLVGRAGRPYSDGNGRRLASFVRRTDAGWHVPDPGTPWDSGFDINNTGDVTVGVGPGWTGYLYLAGSGTIHSFAMMLDHDFNGYYFPNYAYGLNDNLQIAASYGHALMLTPIGSMIIPGDVNGDAEVNHDDHCAWLADPIDLDGDGDVDPDDEQWLIDRLAVFGFIVQDCNLNGINDHCDITGGLSGDCNENDIPDECEPDCDGNGVPDDCESDCNGNGIPDTCDISSGFSEDCNKNGIPDECDVADTVEARVVYDPPQRLYEDETFSDSVLMTEAGIIADVDFTIKDSFRIGQTTVRLSHAGVTVTLIDQPGYPANLFGFSNLGYDITLDDEGDGPNIEFVGVPSGQYEDIVSPPSYKPHQPLSMFNGLPREGEWLFEFIGGFPQHFDPKLVSWSVIVTDEAVDPGDCCPADFNNDGIVNTLDFLAFLNAYNAGDPAADFNNDGIVNTLDFLDFLNAFNTGC